MTSKRSRIAALPALVLPALLLAGCPHKGPAERAGEKIDRAKDKVSDAVDPKGPVEKAGRKIDRAVDDSK